MIHLKKTEPNESKEGLSVIKYFDLFGKFNIQEYERRYLGYYETKREFLDFLISGTGGLPSFVINYSHILGINLNDIIDKESLGRYIFKTQELSKYTPLELRKKALSLKIDPQACIDYQSCTPYEFIGDYEDYEDFNISKKDIEEFRNSIQKHSFEIYLMEKPQFHRDNDPSKELSNQGENESLFYKDLVDEYLIRGYLFEREDYLKFFNIEPIKQELDSIAEHIDMTKIINYKSISNFYFRV